MRVICAIRPFTESDIEKLIILIRFVQRISFKDLYSRELIEAFCKKYTVAALQRRMKYTQFLIAEKRSTKEIIGVIGLKEIMVRGFYIHPNYQGKGIGSMLYKKLEAMARSQGLRELTVESSPIGYLIYIHYGFKKEKEVEKEREGIKYVNIFMRKMLG